METAASLAYRFDDEGKEPELGKEAPAEIRGTQGFREPPQAAREKPPEMAMVPRAVWGVDFEADDGCQSKDVV